MNHMKQITILKKRIIPLLKRNDVVKAGLFGSYARGEAKKNSDVDLLIKYGKKKSLLDVIGLQQELEDVLKRKVDLLTYKAVHPLLKDKIHQEEIKIL